MISTISKNTFDALNLSPQCTSLWHRGSEAAWFASDDRDLLGVITSDVRLMHWTLIICRRRANGQYGCKRISSAVGALAKAEQRLVELLHADECNWETPDDVPTRIAEEVA